MAKKSSSRRCRLPRYTGSARTSSIGSAAMVSGESTSASSGTGTDSFSVSVSISDCMRSLPRRDDFRVPQPLDLHRVVRERHRVDLLEQRPDVVLDRLVAGRADDQLPAVDPFPPAPIL